MSSTYGAFFKVAPALAGAQQDGGSGASNEQMLSLSTGIVENRVRIPLPFVHGILGWSVSMGHKSLYGTI